MTFNVKTWRDTRIPDAEGSGISDAIKAFEKAWPQNAAAVDGKSAQLAFDAIELFRTALTSAEGKCDKAKRPDAKKLAATRKLLKDWRDELKAYEEWLQQTVAKQRDEAAAEVLAAQRQRIIDHVVRGYEEVTTESVRSLQERMHQLDAALKARNISACYTQQTGISKDLRVLLASLTPAGVKERLHYACRDLKLDERLVTAKDCTPPKLPQWKHVAEGLEQVLSRFENELDEIESEHPEPDPEGSTGTADYKKKLKEIIGEYHGVVAYCELTESTLKGYVDQCKRLQAIPAEVRGANKVRIEQASQMLRRHVDEAEAGMKAEVEKIRNNDSVLIKKKTTYGITKEDSDKFLAPIMNRMFSKNMRSVKLIQTVRHLLEELAES